MQPNKSGYRTKKCSWLRRSTVEDLSDAKAKVVEAVKAAAGDKNIPPGAKRSVADSQSLKIEPLADSTEEEIDKPGSDYDI